ncbi:MAG: hypothetical protein E7335_06045 [Clostridiales bacterium]|nr:hypothetical protein [Clostridiales bacterium]
MRKNDNKREVEFKRQTGPFFKFVQMVLCPLFPIRKVPDEASMPRPAVYLCRHADNSGPLYTLLNLKGNFRPWIYYVFCDEKICFEHTYGYTFTERGGKPKPIAWILARLSAFSAPKVVRSMRSIPVYRNSAKSMSTIRESIQALLNGESLLIFPDVNYTQADGDVGEIYRGFLILERMYMAKTGKHLEFVTMKMYPKDRIEIGNSVMFEDGDYASQVETVAAKIEAELNRME